jgi:hypothetical protein
MTNQQKRDVSIIRYIIEAVTEKPEQDLTWDELVTRTCQYGHKIGVQPYEVSNVLVRSVQNMVLRPCEWG